MEIVTTNGELSEALDLPEWDDREEDVVSTDLSSLNEALGGGLRTSNLIMLQAPTGEGKTTTFVRWACLALLQGKKVFFYTINEQDKQEMLIRIKCALCRINYKSKNSNKYDEKEKERMKSDYIKNLLKNLVLAYSENAINTSYLDKVVSMGCNYIFIDYLGNDLPNRSDETYSHLTKRAALLKNFATKNNVCIVTAMQTNRNFSKDRELQDFNPASVDESYMADSVGPARKATVCLALFNYKKEKYLKLYKNREFASTGLIKIRFEPNSLKMIEKDCQFYSFDNLN